VKSKRRFFKSRYCTDLHLHWRLYVLVELEVAVRYLSPAVR
jgi:hypothetical protein